MTKAKWIAIPVLAAAFAFSGAAPGASTKAPGAAASDFSAKKGGKGYAKGHAKQANWRGHYAYKSRGANNPYFCPPGQAKKPGWGSAHMC